VVLGGFVFFFLIKNQDRIVRIIFFLSDNASAGKILGKNLHFLIPGRKASLWKKYFAGLTPPQMEHSILKFRCVSQKYISAKLEWSASV
jgi:hypothetical protein